MPTLVTSRPAVTPGSTGFQDVDISSHVGAAAGRVAGCFIEIVNSSGSTITIGVRKNGSTDTLTGNLINNTHTYFSIGCDSDDIFEVSLSSVAAGVAVYLISYYDNSEAEFLTNASDQSTATTGSYVDVDINSLFTKTPLVAFGVSKETASATRQVALRQNGSTDDRYFQMLASNAYVGWAMGCGSGIFEQKIFGASADIYVVGCLTANATTFANAVDFSTGNTGNYVDVDFSGSIPPDNTGAFVDASDAATASSFNIRRNGDTDDNYFPLRLKAYFWTGIDSGRMAEQKISASTRDLSLWGYTNTPAISIPKQQRFNRQIVDNDNQELTHRKNFIPSSVGGGGGGSVRIPGIRHGLDSINTNFVEEVQQYQHRGYRPSVGGGGSEPVISTPRNLRRNPFIEDDEEKSLPRKVYLPKQVNQVFVDLAGTISGTSGGTGTLEKYVDLAGTVSDTSGGTGTLENYVDLSGSISGTSGCTGTLENYVDLSGTISGTSGLSGTLENYIDLGGSVAGAGELEGDLYVPAADEMAGTVHGQGALSGTLEKYSDLSGGIQGEGELTVPDLPSYIDLAGSISSTSGLSVANLASTTDLSGGVIHGQSALSAPLLQSTQNLAGVIHGVGNLVGGSLSTPGSKELAGTATQGSSASATATKLTFKLAAGTATQLDGTATGTLTKFLLRFSSGVATQSSGSEAAAIKVTFKLGSFNVTAISSVQATASKRTFTLLSGTATATSSAQATLSKTLARMLSAEVTAVSSAEAHAIKILNRLLAGEATANSSASATISRVKHAAGQATAISSASGQLFVLEREQAIHQRCGVTNPIIYFGAKAVVSVTVPLTVGVLPASFAIISVGVGLDQPSEVRNAVAAYLGGGVLLVDWDAPLAGSIEYYEIQLASELVGPYGIHGANRFKATQGYVNNIPNVLPAIFVQVRAVSPQGLLGPWAQAKKGRLTKPIINMRCEAPVGSVIPAGARFAVELEGGRLVGFAAVEEITFEE